MSKFKHKAYGLNIVSDFQLTGMAAADFGHADVVVLFGPVAASLNAHRKGRVTKYRAWEASEGHFLLELDNIAKYLVTGGNRILIEKCSGATDQEVMAFFNGSALTALLQQRGLLTLHASAVKTPQGAALFMGRSGAGKSTLSSAMQQRGYAMLSDDASAIEFDGEANPIILPSFPTTRLWGDSMEKLGEQKASNQKLRAELDKYLVPADRFCEEPQPVSRIFCLNTHNRPTIEIQQLAAADRFQTLSLYTFRKNFYTGQGLGQLYFESVMKLVNSIQVIKISRPESPFLLDELVEVITENLGLGRDKTVMATTGAMRGQS